LLVKLQRSCWDAYTGVIQERSYVPQMLGLPALLLIGLCLQQESKIGV